MVRSSVKDRPPVRLHIRSLIWIITITTAALTLPCATELILIDGRVLTGTDVHREGEVYVLEMENGEWITMPMDLVQGVKLTGNGDDSEDEEETGEPETILKEPVRQRTTSEQLEVMGEPATFREDVIDSTWTPDSDWDMDLENNNFNTSTWRKSQVISSWQPKSDFNVNRNILASSRSNWQASVIDSRWTPTDGFATSVSRR